MWISFIGCPNICKYDFRRVPAGMGDKLDLHVRVVVVAHANIGKCDFPSHRVPVGMGDELELGVGVDHDICEGGCTDGKDMVP